MIAGLEINPYWGKNFFQVIFLFFERIFSLSFGSLKLSELASDEIQIIVLALVALSSSLIGSYLVLKKMTMLANSLSHTILLGIVLAYLFLLPFLPKEKISAHAISIEVLLLASLLTGLITTLLTQFLTSVFRLQEDASTALVFTSLFALGIVLITAFSRNAHIGTEAIMGSVDALHVNDIKLIFWICLIDIFSVGLFYNAWKVTTFDPHFANSIGFSSGLFNYFLMGLTAATVIGAFRAVGVLLVLSFLTAPVLTARLFCHSLKQVIVVAMGIGIFSSFISVALSRHFLTAYQLPLSTSGITVATLALFYFVGWGIKTLMCRQKPKEECEKSHCLR